jgi:hypothetical protein
VVGSEAGLDGAMGWTLGQALGRGLDGLSRDCYHCRVSFGGLLLEGIASDW